MTIKSRDMVAFYVQDPIEPRFEEFWRGRLGDFLMENGITQKADVAEITSALATNGVYRDENAADGIVELQLLTTLQCLFPPSGTRQRKPWPISIGFWFGF